ncbi:Pyruvate decarboxylase 3 [Aspergillus hancockii]|nr:Pyruvate decarboxylase 3 [Aspergillus hancockii]
MTPSISSTGSVAKVRNAPVSRSPEDMEEVAPQSRPDNRKLGTTLAYQMEELGVTDYFVVAGDFNLALLNQLLKNQSFRMIGCCNELNAGYAADGYTRSSLGRVAVVVVTITVSR